MSKKILAIVLSIIMVIAMLPTGAIAADFTDMPNDWSTAALQNAVANGLLTGENGNLNPNNNLTRAQMATIINRAFGATGKASLSGFTDVAVGSWYYDEMAKAVQMKTFEGSNGKLTPGSNITREQAFVVIARAFKLTGGDPKVLDKFWDKATVSSWAKDAVASLVGAGYVAGSNGLLSPDQSITRAQFAQIMYNLLKNYIKSPGTYTQVTAGNVMINASGVTLKNLTVSGDLIIGDGVGDGEVTLDNVKITGRTVIRGGGVNSIKIIGGSELGTVIITKVDGNVRVLSENGSVVEVVIIDDGKDDVILEGTFRDVEIDVSNIPVVMQNARVQDVNITAPNANLTVAAGSTVNTVTIPQSSQGSQLTVAGTITNVTSQGSGTSITGSGTVTNASIQGNNTRIDTVGTNVTIPSGVTGTTSGGQSVNGGTSGSTQQGGGLASGGGAGGGFVGGGDDPTPSAMSITGINTTSPTTVTFNSDVADATIKFNGTALPDLTVIGANTITVPLMVSGANNTLTIEKTSYTTFTNTTVVWIATQIHITGLSVSNSTTVTFNSDVAGATIKFNGTALADLTVTGANTITVPAMITDVDNSLTVEKAGNVSFNGTVVWTASQIHITGIVASDVTTVAFDSDVAGATIKFNGVLLPDLTVSGTNTITVPLMVSGVNNTLTVEKTEYKAFTSSTVVWTEPYDSNGTLGTWATDRTAPAVWDDTTKADWISITTTTETAADSWYDWQGKGAFTAIGPTGQWKVETQIELTPDLLNGTGVRTSFWIQVDGVNSIASTQNNVLDWSILGFKNDPGNFIGWESWDSSGSGAWIPLVDVAAEEGIYTLTTIYDTGTISQYINGVLVRTYDIETDDGFGYVSAPSYLILQSRTYGEAYITSWKVPSVKYVNGFPLETIFISDIAELTGAIDAQADGQIWVLKAGTYDLPRSAAMIDGQAGWYFPITADNLSIIGINSPIISSSEYSVNGALASQNLITIWGNDVTLDGLTIEPKIEANKSVEVIGQDVTVKNCIFTANTLYTGPEAEPTYGGSLYFSGAKENVLVEKNTFNNTSVAFDNAFPTGTPDIRIKDNTWESIGSYAVGNVSWGANPYTNPYADVLIEGNNFNNVTDATKIITARMNQTLTLSATNKINGVLIDKNNFEKYINFNNLAYWILCKDNKVIVDGVTYESPYKTVTSYVNDLSGLPAAIDAATAGDTILIVGGTYTAPTTTINVNKAVTIKGAANYATVITATGGTPIFTLSAGATIDGIFVDKTDKTSQHFITITANDATVQNCKFIGQFVIGDGEVVRAIVPNAGINGYTISGNIFESIRQPAYLEGIGTVTDNFVKNTKGWVVCENHAITFNGNRFEGNAVDIAIIANGTPSIANYRNIQEISENNNGAFVENQVLGASAKGGFLVADAAGSVHMNSIQHAINAASDGDTIKVAAGTYVGNLEIPVANLTLESAADHGSVIQTQAGFNAGNGYGGITILADGVTIYGFLIEQNVGQAIIHTHSSHGATIQSNIIRCTTPGINPRGIDVGYASAPSNDVNVLGNAFEELYCGVYVNQGSILEVSDNTFLNMAEGAVVFDGTWGNTDSITVSGNTATDSEFLLYYFSPVGSVLAEDNVLSGTELTNYSYYSADKGAYFPDVETALSWSTVVNNNSAVTNQMRSIALANDSVYIGYIQTSGDRSVYHCDAAGTVLNSVVTEYFQPKGIATDDRGYVYIGNREGSGSYTAMIQVYNSDLSSVIGTLNAGSDNFGGVAIYQSGDTYYLYVSCEVGGVINRYNITDPANISLDGTFGSGGSFTVSGAGNLRGISVDSDGTIFVADRNGNKLFRISADLSEVTSVSVTRAMDVALYGDYAYVTSYNGVGSLICMINKSSLIPVEEISISKLGGAAYARVDAEGWSGIDIGADGKIWLCDQAYGTNSDRLLVSSAIPTGVPRG